MSSTSTVATQQPLSLSMANPDERDQHGNLILSLRDIGLDTYVRYQKYADGVRLAQIDVVKAVTGKEADYAGNIA